MTKPIYLDYAATTPTDPDVVTAMLPYYTDQFYNPSALYTAAQHIRHDYEEARATIAQLLQVRPSEIVFTAGSTESNNLAINGVLQFALAADIRAAQIAMSSIEHESVLRAGARYGHIVLPVKTDATLDVEKARALITDDTVLVSCMLANNELGTVQPVAELSRLVQQIRADRTVRGMQAPLYLHCDASQAFNYLHVLPHVLGVDLLTLGGSKLYGPKQTGILFLRAGVGLSPQILGGGQEYGLRSGTENVPGVIGLATALQKSAQIRKSEVERLIALRRHLLQKLKSELPQCTINGGQKHTLPNIVHVTIPGIDNERLVMQFDEYGICVASGSACAASSGEPSHVLRAVGLSDEQARSSIRISMGRGTTQQHIDYLLEKLQQLTTL